LRAGNIARYNKHPGALDYQHAVYEIDLMQYENLNAGIEGVRDSYILLLDKIEKNRDRLKPRTRRSNQEGMAF
jgi:hypothetical protein